MAQEKSGRIEAFGVIETQKIAVADGETTKDVVYTQIHHAPVLSAIAGYNSNVWISNATDQGCTLNFTDPTTDKSIDLTIAG